MTGGSAAHGAIKGNIFVALGSALRSGHCRVDVDDLKVVTATVVVYPDVVVTCRPIAPDDDRLSDPTIVVEVLSPSTERHDRIAKWRQYQTIAALEHFVLVAQSERRIEVYTRTESGREFVTVEPPADAIVLKAVGATLSLGVIYENSGR
jgi:Uma2 family endonuclease